MAHLLVGRETQLNDLCSWAAAARDGIGKLVLIRGEAGVGKTALARAAIAESGLWAIEARSTETPAPAYSPIAAVLRSGGRALGRMPADPAVRRSLAAILPELAPAESGPEVDQAVLFEAVAAAFGELAGTRPVGILLDDAHWADAATLDFLAFIADLLPQLPALLLATYRTDGVPRAHPVRELRSRLKRKAALVELTLEPLDVHGTAKLLEARLAGEVSPHLAALVHERSEGLPFYAEELAASLLDSGSLRAGPEGLELDPESSLPFPEAVRDVVLQRVDRLPQPDRDGLAVAAVAGSDASAALLAAFGIEETARLTASGLVQERDAGRLTFRHSLVRDAVYESIPWRRRRTLHADLANHLAGSASPLTIATHRLAAGDEASARGWLVMAAQASQRAGAHRDAAAQLSQALELWPPEADVEGRLEALEQLARSTELAGMTALAIRAVTEAADLLETSRDRERYGAVQRRLALLLEVQGAWERALDARQAAATAYSAAGCPAEAAAEWLAGGAKLRSAGSFKAALAMIAAGVKAAEAATRGDLLCRLRALEGNVRARAGDTDAGLQIVRAALSGALGQGDYGSAAEAYQRLADSLEHAGDYRAARAMYQEAAEFCQANGADALGDVCLACLTMVLRQAGEWDQALETCREVLMSPNSNAHALAVVHGVMGSILLHRGSLRQARSELHASNVLAKRIGLTAMEMDSDAHLGRLAAIEGRTEDAINRCWSMIRRWQRTDRERHYAIPNLRWIATFATQTSSGELLDACAAAVTAVVTARDLEAQAALHHVLGESAFAAGEGATAVTRFEQALAILSDLDLPFEVAEVERRAAAAHGLAGDRRAAVDLYRHAYRAARRLGARGLAQSIAGEVAAIGEKIERRLGRLAAAGLAGDGLSPRELEVVRLVAEGLTSREVAQKLTLSPRTVEMHVHRILIKLDCRSRVDLTRRASELGLLA
jgi:DNA-binding NarL/FixJ family response regulator